MPFRVPIESYKKNKRCIHKISHHMKAVLIIRCSVIILLQELIEVQMVQAVTLSFVLADKSCSP